MNFIINTFLRLLILIICVIIEIITVVNIIKYFSFEGFTNKKRLIFLLLPLVIVFMMFFQGNYRLPKIDIESAISIAQNTVSSKEDKISNGIYDNEQCNIILSSYKSDDAYKELDDISNKYSGIIGFFSKSSFSNEIKYYLTPMTSDRQSEGFYMHQGYRGKVFIAVKKDTIVELDYLVYRKTDKFFGILFSPPIFDTIDFTQIINSKYLVEKQ